MLFKHAQHSKRSKRTKSDVTGRALSQITEGWTIIDSVKRNECVALQTGVTGRSVVVSNVLMCPVLTRNRLSGHSQNKHANPTSERRSDVRIYCYRRTAVTAIQ